MSARLPTTRTPRPASPSAPTLGDQARAAGMTGVLTCPACDARYELGPGKPVRTRCGECGQVLDGQVLDSPAEAEQARKLCLRCGAPPALDHECVEDQLYDLVALEILRKLQELHNTCAEALRTLALGQPLTRAQVETLADIRDELGGLTGPKSQVTARLVKLLGEVLDDYSRSSSLTAASVAKLAVLEGCK